MILEACLVLVFVMLASLWQRGARFRAMGDKLPGPKAYPIFGNVIPFGANTTDLLGGIQLLCIEFHGGPVRMWIGPLLFVLLSNPDDIEIILGSNKTIDKADSYSFMLPWLGTGLLTSTGAKWRKHRKILTPTFHFKILEDFVDVFNANGKIMVEKLQKQVNGPGFDIYKYVTLCALDNICETAMGVKIDAQGNSESAYVQAIRDESYIIMRRSFKPWLGPDFLFNLTSLKTLHDKSLRILHDTTNGVIKSRREEITREKKLQGIIKQEDVNQSDGVKKRLAFLDMLIESTFEGSQLTDENIREEVDTFMFEGHDTTSSGISFALWLLSWNQDAQDKVSRELEEVFPDPEEPLSYRGLQDLKYMEQVIKETLRLYPSVPMYARQLQEDVELSGGHVAPKGATISIVTFMAHRNPDFFPDPEKFDPDRFKAENVQGRHPYAYVPFSAGPRNCIGQKFAMLEMKSTIAHVLRNFKLLPGTEEPDLVLASELILVSTTGVKVKIEARNN